MADTVFDTINHDYDKIESKKRAKQKKFGTTTDEKDSDCILHGYLRKQGGPFGTNWQLRYAKLYPNRLELHSENNKPELTFMDQIEDITSDLVQVKTEQCIILRTRNDGKIVLTNHDEIGLKEWSSSIRTAHKCSLELLSSLAKKAGKIYGTENPTAVSTGTSNIGSSSSTSSTNTTTMSATNVAAAASPPSTNLTNTNTGGGTSTNWRSESGCRQKQQSSLSRQATESSTMATTPSPSPTSSGASSNSRIGNKWLKLKKRVNAYGRRSLPKRSASSSGASNKLID